MKIQKTKKCGILPFVTKFDVSCDMKYFCFCFVMTVQHTMHMYSDMSEGLNGVVPVMVNG